MTKDEALAMIDTVTKQLINPVDLLHWVTLRVIILSIDDTEWQAATGRAEEITSR